ncbi:BspA family leucine-rich repeat surface protein [Bifidobacterium sp. ESL0790]|uniref:BspA family leucine-rich repeat surface protein n=1 Tax=Bifidobacterium sp. ESL0790 TaxID=2983233 RepID=UPI0023F74F1D|nr:BspA family leucine-rich repeat surface protein [Bifidobacterium sp. ESL0790]WEV72069.1 BspA family leucine-rich repeat surface protein [Bifidobacterium sp. ESL0790]
MRSDTNNKLIKTAIALLAATAMLAAPQLASAATPPVSPQVDGSTAAPTQQGDSSQATGEQSGTQTPSKDEPSAAPAPASKPETSQQTDTHQQLGSAPQSPVSASDSTLAQSNQPTVGPQSSCNDSGITPWGTNAYWHVDSDCVLHFGAVDTSQPATLGVTSRISYGEVHRVLPWFDWSYHVQKVKFDSAVQAATRSACLFGELRNVTEIQNLNLLDTKNATNLKEMFDEDNKLTSLDLSNFDTSNVTSMDSMFADTWGLTNLDLSNFNTSKVTNMGGMFYDDWGLRSLDISSFDTSNVTSMSWEFDADHLLTFIRLGKDTTIKPHNELPSAIWTSEDGISGDPSTDPTPFGTRSKAMWYSKVSIAYLFDGNGASGGTPVPLAVSGSTYTAPDRNSLEKTGYEFLGWSASSEATEPTYHQGDPLTEYSGNTVRLYAVWKIIPVANMTDITAPKSSEGLNVDNNSEVTITGTLTPASGADDVSVSLLPSGSTSATPSDGKQGTTTFNMSANTWSATFHASDFTDTAADTTGTGVDYVIRARLHNSDGDSAYTYKTVHVDMTAPSPSNLVSDHQKVTGTAMSAKDGLSGVTPAAEQNTTVTITWLDKDGDAITADTPSVVTSAADGTFEANWPTDRKAVKAGVQAKDTTGNTSATTTLDLGRPADPDSTISPEAPTATAGVTPTGQVSVTGTVSGTHAGDSVIVRLLPSGKTATDAEAGQGILADSPTLDTSTGAWTADFPNSAFADEIGTGTEHTFCAKLHTDHNGDSAYTCQQHNVDMVAPVATQVTFTAPAGSASGMVTGKVLSSADETAQPHRAAEGHVTLTLAWFDADGQPLTTPGTLSRGGTPLTTTATSQTDGTFSAEWPASVRLGYYVTVTARDGAGNTSAPTSMMRLGTPASYQPQGSSGRGSGSNSANGNGPNRNGRLSSTGAAIAGTAMVAILMAGIGLVLNRSKAHMSK